VPTLISSDENRLCEAIELSRLFVKPRTAFFPEKKIEAAPLNPVQPLRLETQSKKEG
jgi:hypothetical protein